MKYITFGAIFILMLSCQKAQEQKTETSPPFYSTKGKTATFYITAQDSGFRLHKYTQQTFDSLPQPKEHDPLILVDPNKQFQTIEGIGGALTDAAAETLSKLSSENQKAILNAYFDKEDGIGYSLCRTHIHSCDFSSESYTYIDDFDTLLETFSIDHDKQFKIPLIKKAMSKAGSDLKLMASPWSPPAWMKSNNRMVRGGKLLPEYRQAWANYYIKFLDEYTKAGIPIWGMSIQNETMAKVRWESCEYTAQEERDFVKNHLGPTLKASQFADTKLIIWDHNRGLMYQRAQEIYSDPDAAKYVWGTGYHWYAGDHFDNVKRHYESFPDKKLLFTEGCLYPFKFEEIGLWKWGETYGRSMIHDFNNGAVGWIDWNILLDETGGPNHVNNFCFSPIIGDTRNDSLHFMNSYYYIGHFSKFVRPGAKRVACASSNDNLIATAFINPDGSVVGVIMNETNESIDFTTWIDKTAVDFSSPAHSIITITIN